LLKNRSPISYQTLGAT